MEAVVRGFGGIAQLDFCFHLGYTSPSRWFDGVRVKERMDVKQMATTAQKLVQIHIVRLPKNRKGLQRIARLLQAAEGSTSTRPIPLRHPRHHLTLVMHKTFLLRHPQRLREDISALRRFIRVKHSSQNGRRPGQGSAPPNPVYERIQARRMDDDAQSPEASARKVAVGDSTAAGLVIVFPDCPTFERATRVSGLDVSFTSRRLQAISVDFGGGDRRRLAEKVAAYAKTYDGVVLGDYVQRPLSEFPRAALPFDEDYGRAAPEGERHTLGEMMAMIRAETFRHRVDAAYRSNGDADVLLAIVDSGVEGSRSEIDKARRSPGYTAGEGGLDPWEDQDGHGTMVATIAAGGTPEFSGVLPQVKIHPCRTPDFRSVKLADLLEHLAELAREGKRVVANCSWGISTGSPPPDDPSSIIDASLDSACQAGVAVCFSAGNYNELLGEQGRVAECDGRNTIWTYKSRPDVLVVATCDEDKKIWDYSSRGPGQRYNGLNGTVPAKPDITAPTPRDGRIPMGKTVRIGRRGWGTSGASPQAAALCAGLWMIRPDLTAQAIFDVIRRTAVDIGVEHACQGSGLIDCDAASGAI